VRAARFVLAVLALASFAFAEAQHGAAIQPMTVYLTPDTSSQRIGTIPRGRDIAILETSPGWLHVYVDTDQQKTVSGWIEDKGVVRASTPNGDRILFGAATDSEAEAQKPHGRKGADMDAGRLYKRISDFFPNSSIAGEALYRSADIKWQIDSIDVWTLPSAKEEDPSMRPKIDDEMMKQVKKKFPGTKWADLADYAMLDNKICGDWQAKSKCPEKEAELYTKYADEHPKSPKLAEALYNAAYREASLVDIFRTEGDEGKSNGAKQKAVALTQRLSSTFPDSDWATRAILLQFKVQQGMPVYGSPSD
jgi:outer membrane protein assembly factor BamD (BamD/ComL family)